MDYLVLYSQTAFYIRTGKRKRIWYIVYLHLLEVIVTFRSCLVTNHHPSQSPFPVFMNIKSSLAIWDYGLLGTHDANIGTQILKGCKFHNSCIFIVIKMKCIMYWTFTLIPSSNVVFQRLNFHESCHLRNLHPMKIYTCTYM